MTENSTTWTTLRTQDGPMKLYVARPEHPNGCAVIVLQEAFGVNDHIQDVTRRFATRGYVAMAPQMFHRTGTDVVPYADHTQVMPLIGALGAEQIGIDIGAVVEHLHDSEGLEPAQIAIVGFCFGGRAAFTAATLTPGLGAAAVFYGPGIAAGPHAVLDRVGALTAPLVMHVGGQDPTIPNEQVDAIHAAMRNSGTEFACYVYPDAGHAFACDARPHMYVAQDARIAWDRTYDFLDRFLPRPLDAAS